MKIETKYNIDQEIFTIELDDRSVCGSQKWEPVDTGIIKRIALEDTIEYFYVEPNSNSGWVDEANAFPTLDAAEAECAKRNQEAANAE